LRCEGAEITVVMQAISSGRNDLLMAEKLGALQMVWNDSANTCGNLALL
jgi:hypothetical protein